MKNCTFDGCENEQHARGLCSSHRKQANAGKPLSPLKDTRKGMPLHERLEFLIHRTEACWNWVGATNTSGYGLISVSPGKKVVQLLAHRVAYEKYVGEIANGMLIDHKCHNKACVNPEHLRVVTNKQNMEHRSGAQKNNKSSGIRGVTLHKKTGKWKVEVTSNQVRYYVGLFDELSEAEEAARAKRNELFTHNLLDRVS